mmetsp:Transcript_2298/g.4663  ORF Transcript_2298/g.4663 Transcript_2298/m.4663 type:complete len:492 (-) Transcript_2298:708-2183(-)
MYEHTGGLAVVGSPPAQSVNVHNSNRGRSSPISQSPKLGNRFSPTCAENARSLQQGLPRARPLLFNNGLTDQDSVKREPFVIGVAGGTASGKTTVCNQIMQSLHDQRVAMISMDSFYRGLTEYEKANVSEYNFDHPNSFDAQEIAKCLVALKTGGDVEVPEYCFVTHQRLSQSRRVNSSDVVIIEGILLFQFDEIVEHLNMKIFVDTDDDVRLARRIQRDTLERGRDVKGVIDQYTKFVKPMFEQFVLPSKKAADIIIPWARGDNVVAIDLIVQHIQTKLGQHDLRRIYSNLDVLPGNYQTRGMHTTIRNRNASKSDFVFYSNRLIRLVVEHGLGQLPFTEKVRARPRPAALHGEGGDHSDGRRVRWRGILRRAVRGEHHTVGGGDGERPQRLLQGNQDWQDPHPPAQQELPGPRRQPCPQGGRGRELARPAQHLRRREHESETGGGASPEAGQFRHGGRGVGCHRLALHLSISRPARVRECEQPGANGSI